MRNKIDILRKQIDTVDNSIVSLLAKRMEVVKQIGEMKKENNLSYLDNKRWQKILSLKLEQAKFLGLNQKLVKKIYTLIHEEALKIEKEISQNTKK